MPFAGPINVDSNTAGVRAQARAREVRCTCAPSPFCSGPAGAGFWDCDLRCRACRLPPWQPVNARGGDDAPAD